MGNSTGLGVGGSTVGSSDTFEFSSTGSPIDPSLNKSFGVSVTDLFETSTDSVELSD